MIRKDEVVKDMRTGKRSGGFTMAELLVVVAIITILAGVSFIAVQRHQESLGLLERNAIAKEIYVAAQNHLTMAEGQGYLGAAKFGTAGASDGEYYFIYDTDRFGGNTLLDQMLPLGSIDETVRTGGRYLIRYKTNPAAVLDVCYWTPSGTRYGGSVGYSDLSDMLGAGPGKKIGSVLVGWYGGDAADIAIGERLNAPAIVVKNEERLTVEVTPNNVNGTYIKLIITGVDSEAQAVIPVWPDGNHRVNDDLVVTLDDITQAFDTSKQDGCHFADLKEKIEGTSANDEETVFQGEFWPGEDITIKAVAYNNDVLTNIAYSNEWTTNSLFSDVVEASEESGGKVALIANARHLENLDKLVSGVNLEKLGIVQARQTADILWKDDEASDTASAKSTAFTYRIAQDKGGVTADKVKVYKLNDATGTAEGCFLPVNPDSVLIYDGGIDETEAQYHRITGVKVETEGAAGLFGAPTAALTVQNLELIDFDITGSGDAGALAGALADGSSVRNVRARNSEVFDKKKMQDKKPTITASGSAGGLIGSANGATIDKSAAALVVESTGGSAGGLIGTAEGGSVTGSYSGGHTVDKKDGENVIGIVYDTTSYNVTASAAAGGLIGSARGTKIEHSYSTCSATGETAGGLVGKASGEIENSYAVGRVKGTSKQGAFAGELSGTARDSLYFEIINETPDDATGAISYLPPVDGAQTVEGVTPLDASVESYNAFCGAPSVWKGAIAYNKTQARYYTVD